MNPPTSVARTARERARAELTREIKEEARRQLADVGADALSLRAVARELGMVSSALYRYYPSKDDLLTALIIDAYNAIGDAAETAIASASGAPSGSAAAPPATAVLSGSAVPSGSAARRGSSAAPSGSAVPPPSGPPGRVRWLAACRAIRAWAVAHPHEYALIYGSPVPGYRAPEATIGPAARVPLAFVGVLRDAVASGEVADAASHGVTDDGADQDQDQDQGSSPAPSPARSPAPGPVPDPLSSPLPGPIALPGPLAEQAAALSAALAAEGAAPVPGELLVRGVIAWTQLFGMLSFELFGQFVGSFDPTDEFFGYAAAQLAAFAGLR